MKKKIEVEIPDGRRAEWVNGVLTLVNDTSKDVRDRVKTFEDACEALGENHQYVRAYREWMRISYTECEDITAYMKLRIITAALNEGWKPKFKKDEKRWYSLFDVRQGDFVCAYASGAASGSNASHGVRLALKSKELAEYAGKQFIDIYKDFCFKTSSKEQ